MPDAILVEKIFHARAVGNLRIFFARANNLFEAPKKQNAHTHAAILSPAAIARPSFLSPHRASLPAHLITKDWKCTASTVQKTGRESEASAPGFSTTDQRAILGKSFRPKGKV
jgi:hypothetical protein